MMCLSGGTISSLDIACGFPNPSEPYEKRGTIGIDLQRGYADVIADAHALPFRDAVFNVVMIHSALDHFQQPRQVLKEAVRVLKAGETSRVVVSVSNSGYWGSSLNPSPKEHFYQWNMDTLKNLLGSVDLEVLKTEFVRSMRRRGEKERVFEFVAKLLWRKKGINSFLSEVIAVSAGLKK